MKQHTLTDEHKEHCRCLGIAEPPGTLTIHHEDYESVLAAWRRTLPDADADTLHKKVLGHFACHQTVSMPASPFPLPPTPPQIPMQTAIAVQPPELKGRSLDWSLWVWRIAVLFLMLWLCLKPAHAQFSRLNSIGFLDSAGAAITNGYFTYPFQFKCAGTLSCSSDGYTVTATGGAAGATAWSAITAPAANLSLNMAAYTSLFTWNAATGASVMFRLTDTLNNTGTGYLLSVDTASGSGVKPVRFAAGGTSNGVEMSTAGLLGPIGTGGINATQINGTALSGLATGILKNTTTTGVPSIAVAGDFPTLNQSTTGNAATATALAANGTNCAAGSAAAGVDASGNAEGCAAYLTANQSITLSGDVTGTGATAITTTAVNLPDGVTQAGHLLATNIAAPASPAAGKVKLFTDSTDLRFHDKNAAGTIGTTVVADTGAANNFLTAISAAGAISKAQPTPTNVGLGNVTNDVQTKAAIVPNTAPTAGQILAGNAGGTAYAPVSMSGDCTLASTGAITCTKSNGSTTTITVASGTSALGTGAITANTCAAVVTTGATGTATTDAIIWTPNADISAVTGYGAASTDGLKVYPYPTLNNVNFKVCNATGASITPGAVTLNWRVVR